MEETDTVESSRHRRKSSILESIGGLFSSRLRRASSVVGEYTPQEEDLQIDAEEEEVVDIPPSKYPTLLFLLNSDKIFVNFDTPPRILKNIELGLMACDYEFQKLFHRSKQIPKTLSAKLKGYPFLDRSPDILSKMIEIVVNGGGYRFATSSELMGNVKLVFVPTYYSNISPRIGLSSMDE